MNMSDGDDKEISQLKITDDNRRDDEWTREIKEMKIRKTKKIQMKMYN